MALSQLNGRVLPVPGLNWLSLEINTGGNNLMLGGHVDIGSLLPPSLGFGPSSAQPIGGPPAPQPFVPGQPTVQREVTPEAEEEKVQMKPLANAMLQREAMPEEEQKVQTKPSLQRVAEGGSHDATSNLESQLSTSKGGGSPLPDDVRSFMEPRFGADFSQVRVHTGGEAVQMNRELNAQAFTHGSDVYFGEGRYNPSSSDGKRLLAHELTHVVQQTGGVQRQDDVIQAQDNHSGNVIDQLRKALDGWGSDSSKVLQLLRGASPSERQQILADSALMDKLRSKLGRSEMLQALDALQAPLKDKLNAAMKGWGCDAEAIKALTKGASDTDKQAVLNDTALVSRLPSELSRADMLAVLGNLNAPLKDKLNAAMNGWGCDAEAIKTLTKGASDTDKQAVLNDAALVSRLSSELSRADMLAVLGNLNAPLKDKLNAAMNGWGTDEEAIRNLFVKATESERNTALGDIALMSRLASELSLSDMMSILKDAGVPFKTRFELALNRWSAGLNDLRPLVESVTDSERQTVWSDATLMNQANTALGEQDYLTLVTVLRMFQPGTTAEDGKSHTSAAEADTYIQTHLATYVTEAVKQGRQISGLVGVVDDTDWNRAGIAHYGESTWNGGKKTSINGFVDSQGRVWIHKDRGNAGTMIHEAIHKYSDEALIGISQPLNEGVTEYFTRKVCDALTPPITGRGNYQNNYDCVVTLVSLVTEATLASAYFDGQTDALKDAFVKAKSEDDWNEFIDATKNNQWAKAAGLSTP
jgi:hypothetical protein